MSSHPSREHSLQPSSNPQNNGHDSRGHAPPQVPSPDPIMNIPPTNGSNASFTFAYHLDPVTNSVVRTPIPPQPDEQSDLPDDNASPSIQARTSVTVHTLDDSPSSPNTGEDEAPEEQQLPRELVDSIMNTINAMMGVVPNGSPPRGSGPNSETGLDRGVQLDADMTHRNVTNDIHASGFSLHSSGSIPNLTTSTPGSSAPVATTSTASSSNPLSSTNPRRTFAVEEMDQDEYADMPGLLEPSPGSSVANTPLRQAEGSLPSQARTRRSENSNLMQSLMEAAAAEREGRQNDTNDSPQYDAWGVFPIEGANPGPPTNPTSPNPPNPPAANANATNAPNANPNPIRITRLNASDLPGGGANLFGFPGGLMGGLMGLPGLGLGGGIPLSMLSAERPPDTRRAKELLKGLTVVPHGLVRRLERVEALKDKMVKEKMRSKGEVVETVTKSEGNAIGEGKLLCPVCYEALLPDPDAKEEEGGETMDVDEDEDDEMDTKPDVADSSTAADPALPTPPLSTTEKAEQSKHKQKHPYQQPNALIALPCTHIFHASSCLKPWFETGKTTCPTCRFDIDPRSETLDLNWLQNAGRRRAATANGNANANTNAGATNEANAGVPPVDAAPAVTPGAPNADANPTLNPNPEVTATGNDNGNPEGGAPGADFRQVFTNVLRNAIAQAMAAALVPPTAAQGQPQPQPPPPSSSQANQGLPPQVPGLQTQGLHPGLRTPGSQPGSREGTRPPPSPQALAFQRAFDAQQQETASQGQPSEQAVDPVAPDAEPTNPPPPTTTTNSANPQPNPTAPAEGVAPRLNYDVLVRDIILADQGDGQMDVFMREMVMPPSIIPGFDWSDMPVGPGPSAAPSNNNNTANASTNTGGEGGNANLENSSAGMEGVENTNATPSPSTPSNSAGPSPSRFPGFGQGLRSTFTTRRAAYLTPDGVYVPAEPRASSSSSSNSGSGLGSSGTRQASTSTDPESSSTTNLSPPTSNPSRPRTPVPSATRHHPYASPRSSNLNPASPAPSRGVGSDEPSPIPFNAGTPAETPATGNGNQDNLSFSRHSITFSFSFGRGPDGQLYGGPIPPPPAAGNGNETNNNNTTPGQNNNEGRPDRSPFGPEGFLMGGDIIFGMGPPPFGMGAGLGTGASPRTPRTTRPKKKWVAPEGTSLRSVVESKEREVGLRCDDVSCLWGPEDDDDLSSELKIREARVWLKKRGSDGLLEPSCAHRFHPECLLVANRVADQHLDEEIMQDGDDAALIEAACPFCRARGALRREEWRDARERVETA